MTRLYCEKHGQEDETATIERQDHFREVGESVLIVKGRLTSGPWLCDRCNAELDEGNRAYVTSAFPAWLTERTHDYDFGYERQYFAVEHADVSVYGVAWPAVMTAARRLPSSPRRQPLCALDLGPKKQRPAE